MQGIRRARRSLEISFTSWIKANPKVFYTCIKIKKITMERLGAFKKKGGNVCFESEVVVDVLNKCFSLILYLPKSRTWSLVRSVCGLHIRGHFEVKKEMVLVP